MVDVGGRPVFRAIVTSLLAMNMLFILPHATGDDGWVDRCVAVIDGDTIIVARGAERVEVDLDGIDCPELGQPFGDEAKRFTAGRVCRQIVKVQVKRDSNGHTIGRVTIFGRDLPLELVEAGLAWHDHRKMQDPALAKAENEARQTDRGLWSDQNPIAPWVWRLGHREPAHPRDGCL
jgi:endonuclease YncB( thermonuclease family)